MFFKNVCKLKSFITKKSNKWAETSKPGFSDDNISE